MKNFYYNFLISNVFNTKFNNYTVASSSTNGSYNAIHNQVENIILELE